MNDQDRMQHIDAQLAHVWVVRTFLKHSEEAADDEEFCEVHRTLYDYMLAVGKPWQDQDAAAYLTIARKKIHRLRTATDLFIEIQPEVSSHMNFRMAAQSLRAAVGQVESLLEGDS